MSTYANIAKNVSAGDYAALTNAYWSPLYPALLSALLPTRLSVESLRMAFLALQLVEHSFFIVVLLNFAIGISHLRAVQGKQLAPAIFASSVLFGMALYLKFAIFFTPDQILASTILLVLGLICRILLNPGGLLAYAVLGEALALAYWAKAIMMPASLLLLSLIFLAQERSGRRVKPLLLTALFFFVSAAPAVVLASRGANKLTFGDSGKLNYAWNVNRYQVHRGWLGREPGSGTPQHPPRVLVEHPLVLEFADPGPYVYPLWYDPVLWHRGIQIRLSMSDILSAIRVSIENSPIIGLCLVGTIPGLFMGWRSRSYFPFARVYWSCFLLWPLLVLFAYLCVVLELRYALPFLIAFVVASAGMCSAATNVGRRITWVQVTVLCIISAWMIVGIYAKRGRVESRWDEEIIANRTMLAHGIGKGDKLAFVNRLDGSLLFLLPLDVQIISWLRQAVPGSINEAEWNTIVTKWRLDHVKAVINLPVTSSESFDSMVPNWMGFERIPQTQYFVKFLEP
jgi:hypothetical protein